MSASPPVPPQSGPPEYLESGAGGGALPAEPRRASPVRKTLLLGGGAVGLAAVGVGAWAAYSFFGTGPQPAQALPAGTLGYVSVDLDPSGGQKLEALRTLNKFPAFQDEVGIHAGDDLRKAIFDRIEEDAGCAGLDYADDIDPWLGDRAAVAAVDLGADTPDPVVVLQVKNGDKADAGLQKIKACGGSNDVGWAIDGGWAVVAESDDIADSVVAATRKGSLADDDDFQKWTGEAGDPGVATLYAGPAAGDYLADHVGDLGFPFGALEGYACGMSAVSGGDLGFTSYSATDDPTGGCADAAAGGPDVSAQLQQKLRDFKGMAATVRFDGGAIELEAAGDSGGMPGILSAGGTADVVKTLPADTGAVLGLGFADGWFGDLVDAIAPYTGQDASALLDRLSQSTGLDLPGDVETLAGDSAALTLGSDFDPETALGGSDGSDLPIALKVKGDPDKIAKVLDKLRDQAGPQADVLQSDAEGDTIVIGPDPDYRAAVLGDGHLGDNHVFQDAVREADQAQTVLFVNVDELEAAIDAAAGDSDDDLVKNLKPVSGLGITGWVDHGVAHAVIRLTTD